MMRAFFAFLFFPIYLIASEISYTVEFEGVDDAALLSAMKSISQLTSLKKHPPTSLNALRHRAESDIPDFLKLLKARGYFEAKVAVRVQEIEEKAQAIITVYKGPRYTIGSYTIFLYQEVKEECFVCPHVTLEKIGITPGENADAFKILDAELKMLQLLAGCGYPLARVKEREMVADGATKTLEITIDVRTGIPCTFGSVTIVGNTEVKSSFIQKKIAWNFGDVYNAFLVERTQKQLLDTGLFSSVVITHGQDTEKTGILPMKIEVSETKHRSVNVGISYQTFYGPGITFGWENRNVAGLGRRFHIQGDVTKRSHSGIATYMLPDFGKMGQDYLWQAEAMHQSIIPFSERSYSLLNRLERKVGKNIRVSMGAKLEKLYVTSSVDNGIFYLLEVPLYFRWSSANDLLNPTKGATFEYRAIPSTQLNTLTALYFINRITQTFYTSITQSDRVVLAHKFEVGSIPSHTLAAIPVPKRFFGGTEEDLRGYGYLSVSPLGDHRKPRGGKSLLFYTFETRFRCTQKIGIVPFFDMGAVYLSSVPNFKGKWFKSTGFGLRYFTFFGPLRFDLAFPLDRRPHIDPYYRILVSIGQMF